MARPPIDDDSAVTDIARLMLDGDYFDVRLPPIGFRFGSIAYSVAREKVCDRAGVPAEGRARRTLRWRLNRKFRETAGMSSSTDLNTTPLDVVRMMAIDARLPGMAERHPDLAAAIDLDRLTNLRRHHPASLAGWLRVQVELYG